MSHDDIARTFDEWVKNGEAAGLQDGHGDVVGQVIASIEFKAGDQTLDLGCGTGWATRLLANGAPGSGAVGVDVSPEMIAQAESLHDWTYRARYERGTFENLDFPDGKFDHVFSMEALYYAVDVTAALSEVARVMKSGATADLVIDHFSDSVHTRSWGESIGLSLHTLSEAEWKSAVEDAGLSGVTTSRVIDTRMPDEATFKPNVHCPTWEARMELHQAGSLWIHATKP